MGGLGSGLDMGYVMGRVGGGSGWRIHFYLGNIIMKGMRLDYGIWSGIPLFWDLPLVRTRNGYDVGRFGVGFGHRRS